MKQPILGQKIQEWRKAKGLTQEELVERCNLNVRTIQRIEAGEVTPRPYTVKAIMEVLEVNFSDEVVETNQLPGPKGAMANSMSSWLRTSFFCGILYLILSMVEGLFDLQLLTDSNSFRDVSPLFYISLKFGIIVLFLFFNLSFFKLAELSRNYFLQVMTVILILATCIFLVEDIIVFIFHFESKFSLILRAVISGIIYVLFAASFLNQSKDKKVIYTVAVAVGIVTGICFMTVVFAIPGLILLTVFEVVLVVLLYQEYEKMSGPKHVFG
ncbi:helix-turn-helix domain-containing protein [Belliella kenyensis]|uniref:Helix-turn-helix domain-containing protein n=1 Tax=Belliella kenyensis TaxID=1472724 RepID=A0ABV8EKY6_9BACT|nr:helix-turn-helix transcriptional regulator [Belliella kenyensis]MCH7403024.1 helix-turn-helix domain-containing protein [Belliella kenyensis]MDN3605060.1 helix-turn-helix transcriptional regulator [Belliella kenyensis]